MKEPTAIASFDSADPAQIVAGRLRDTCFQAAVVDTSGDELWVRLGLQPRGQFKVMVPLVQAERALSWLREFDASEQLLAAAVRCPECGSTRVEFPGEAQHQLGELFTVPSDPLHHDYLCRRCKLVWQSDSEPTRPAAHLAA